MAVNANTLAIDCIQSFRKHLLWWLRVMCVFSVHRDNYKPLSVRMGFGNQLYNMGIDIPVCFVTWFSLVAWNSHRVYVPQLSGAREVISSPQLLESLYSPTCVPVITSSQTLTRYRAEGSKLLCIINIKGNSSSLLQSLVLACM